MGLERGVYGFVFVFLLFCFFILWLGVFFLSLFKSFCLSGAAGKHMCKKWGDEWGCSLPGRGRGAAFLLLYRLRSWHRMFVHTYITSYHGPWFPFGGFAFAEFGGSLFFTSAWRMRARDGVPLRNMGDVLLI